MPTIWVLVRYMYHTCANRFINTRIFCQAQDEEYARFEVRGCHMFTNRTDRVWHHSGSSDK